MKYGVYICSMYENRLIKKTVIQTCSKHNFNIYNSNHVIE